MILLIRLLMVCSRLLCLLRSVWPRRLKVGLKLARSRIAWKCSQEVLKKFSDDKFFISRTYAAHEVLVQCVKMMLTLSPGAEPVEIWIKYIGSILRPSFICFCIRPERSFNRIQSLSSYTRYDLSVSRR